jgi:hypothetical protein
MSVHHIGVDNLFELTEGEMIDGRVTKGVKTKGHLRVGVLT